MKSGTIDHPKTKRLARRLGINLAWAVGILESLWHFTRERAPRGDIGRYADDEIADAVYWPTERPAGDLVAALIDCGWLDRHDQHRLLVHDWPEHAESYVHAGLAKKTELFADGSRPRLEHSHFSGPVRARIHAEYRAKYQADLYSDDEGDKVPTKPGKHGDNVPHKRQKVGDKRGTNDDFVPPQMPMPMPNRVEDISSSSTDPDTSPEPPPPTTTKPKPKAVAGFQTPAQIRTNGHSRAPAPRRQQPDIRTPEQAQALYEARNALIRFTRACPGPAATWDPPDWDLVAKVLQKTGGIDGISLMLKHLEAKKSQPGHSWGWFLTCADEFRGAA